MSIPVTATRPLESGLVVDLKFNEGAGEVAHDNTENRTHLDGAWYGSPAWISGGGIDFPANGDSIGVSDVTAFGPANITIYMKIKMDVQSSSWGDAVQLHQNGTSGRFAIEGHTNGRIFCVVRNQANVSLPPTLGYVSGETGNIIDVVIVIDNTKLDWYVNGVLIGTRAAYIADGGDIVPDMIRLGYKGIASIYKVKAWSRALSEEEIKQLSLTDSTPDIKSGLVVDLKFNEGTGEVAHDYSGERNHAAFPGGAANPTWIAGGGLLFEDADSEYVEVSADASLNIEQQDHSIICHFKPTGTDPQADDILNKNGTFWQHIRASGQVQLGTSEGYSSYGGITVAQNEEAIVAWVHDATAGTLKIYKNGELQTTIEYDGTPLTQNNYITIGGRNRGISNQLDGEIYWLKMYDKKLSEEEVKLLSR